MEMLIRLREKKKIGKLEVRNSLVMPPMATAKSPEDGCVTDDQCEYYAQRAAGGHIGLIITEHFNVSKQGRAHAAQTSVADDSCIEGMRKLTSVIKKDGSCVFAQINHAGSATSAAVTGSVPVGPSAVIHPRKKDEVPEELTKEEILRIEEQFAKAAARVKAAGYDGVEIHCAHGYLLNQFYSPLTNMRGDEYGCGSVENRTRITCEIIKKVRQTVGDDYPVAVRLGGCDYTEGGSIIEDAVAASLLFEKAGADMIDITGGVYGYVRKDNTLPGYFADMSADVKNAVSVPVILTGGVTEPEQAEKLLEAGCADLIGVGRALYKDAAWAKEI